MYRKSIVGYLVFASHLFLLQSFSHQNQSSCSNNLEDEEFSHLLNLATNEGNNKIHLISEYSKVGIRIQIEEFLHLKTWNQFIQFKWHHENSIEITTILVKNEQSGKRILVKYEPYRCKIKVFDSNGDFLKDKSDWFEEKPINKTIIDHDNKVTYHSIIDSIISTSHKSPFMARVQNTFIDNSRASWVFGIIGLLMKAQYPGSGNLPPKQMSHLENNQRVLDPNSWSLRLNNIDKEIMYYFLARDKAQQPKSDKAFVRLIEIRANSGLLESTIDIIDLYLNYSDELTNTRLTSLPIGFGCRSNPFLVKRNLEFVPQTTGSYLADYELVAINYINSEYKYDVEIKTVTMVRSRHPVSFELPLTLFQVHEDQLKMIRDFQSRLVYKIRSNSIDKRQESKCEIEHLHLIDSKCQHAKNTIDIRFDNGMTLSIDELALEFIFNSQDSKENQMRYLNRVKIDHDKEEHIFETELPDYYHYMLNLIDTHETNHSISVIRVYQSMFPNEHKDQSKVSLKLSRIVMILFDSNKEKKLAELRWNLIRELEPLSLRRRAKLFDLSDCLNLDEESFQLIATFPLDSEQLDLARSKSYNIVEDFYRSHTSCENDTLYPIVTEPKFELDPIQVDKKRVESSLNFLRLPEVRLLASEMNPDEIELHLTILDQVSPIYMFEQLETSDIIGDLVDKILVRDLKQCAKFCKELDCRMFSFDGTSSECKLSQMSMEDDFNVGNRDTFGRVKIVAKAWSKVYYLPEGSLIDKREASLKEVYSYFEQEHFQAREKRSSNHISMMSFNLISGQESKGKVELLSPIEIRALKVPLIFDYSKESQKIKVSSSFSSQLTSKHYQLNAIDDWGNTTKEIIEADERTFINLNRSIYYTLKRLNAIEMDACMELCYNLEEFDFQTGSEQICISFSYCKFEKHCVLVIKTDLDFTPKLMDSTRAEDIVLTIESPEVLIRDSSGCEINQRNFLANFESPIKLPVGTLAYANTYGYLAEDNIEFEWLKALEMSQKPDESESSVRELCARACLDRSKLSDRMCLSFDYCETKQIVRQKQTDTSVGCHLFLLRFSRDKQDEKTSRRARLTSLLEEYLPRPDPSVKIKSVCDRYLASYLIEYNHLRRVKSSYNLLMELKGNLDVDDCALECSIHQPDCFLFQHCTTYDAPNHRVVKVCNLVRGFNQSDDDTALGSPKPKHDETTDSLFGRDCHVYLRREYRSLDEAARGSIIRKEERIRDEVNFIVDYGGLMICFIIIYLLMTVSLVAYIISNHQGKRIEQPETREPVRLPDIQMELF